MIFSKVCVAIAILIICIQGASAQGTLDYPEGNSGTLPYGESFSGNQLSPMYQYRQYYTPFGSVTTPLGVPGFSQPVPFGYGRGYYTIATPKATYHFWRAPSGYYYPFYHGTFFPYGYGANMYNQGTLQPSKPSLDVVIEDMSKFLQQAKTEGKLKDTDYAQLNKRLNDLISKTKSVRFNEGGTLSAGSEDDLRADFDHLSKEISFRLH